MGNICLEQRQHFFREILLPTVKLIFSSSYTYMMWLKIKIYFGILKNWIRKHDGLWNTHLEGGNVLFHWGFETATSASSKNPSLHYSFWNGFRLHNIWYLQWHIDINNGISCGFLNVSSIEVGDILWTQLFQAKIWGR